jgi:hypothetical protein
LNATEHGDAGRTTDGRTRAGKNDSDPPVAVVRRCRPLVAKRAPGAAVRRAAEVDQSGQGGLLEGGGGS